MAKRSHRFPIGLALAFLVAPLASSSNAQDSAPPAGPSREAALEERLKALESRYEAMERRHSVEMEAIKTQYESLRSRVDGSTTKAATTTGSGGSSTAKPTTTGASDDSSSEGGAGARDNPATDTKPKPGGARRLPLNAMFGPGFEFMTEDSEFQLQVHALGQVDFRGYEQSNQDPVASGFSFPRERLIFSGRLTKPIEYYASINRAFGNLDLFDAFINYRFDDRLMFKVGRYKTPFSYEFYAMSGADFVVPERSLFASNFTPNRQLGAMAWGQLWDKRIDYAAGLFNGNRLSFQDNNENKNIIAYLNARPFGGDDTTTPLLKNLNVGGSVDFGNESGIPLPNILRTSIAASNANDALNIAPAFLAFNKNVVESGYRSLWGAHVAYFYKQLTIMAEWNGGYATYALGTSPYRTRVPLNGYYATFGYFLTGETLERRGPIRPLKPFDLRPGRRGPGAWEVQGRYSRLDLGEEVFLGGLADPNLWARGLYSIDLGVNWYLNEYAKIVFEWEHAVFDQPVQYRSGSLQKTSDMLWMRFQFYF